MRYLSLRWKKVLITKVEDKNAYIYYICVLFEFNDDKLFYPKLMYLYDEGKVFVQVWGNNEKK